MKDLGACERKLSQRNERIADLEELVTAQEAKIAQRNQRYEDQLRALRQQAELCESYLPISDCRDIKAGLTLRQNPTANSIRPRPHCQAHARGRRWWRWQSSQWRRRVHVELSIDACWIATGPPAG